MIKKFLPLIELVFGFLIAFLIINSFFNKTKQFENFDLGSETASFFASDDSFPIHLSKAGLYDFEQLERGWEKRGNKPVVLILGNSQTHAINQFKPGEVNFPAIMHERLKGSGYDVLCHSIPNGNLQELYLLSSYYIDSLPIKKLILPVFIDDLREDGIREVYTRVIIESHFRINDSSSIGTTINDQLKSFSVPEKQENEVVVDNNMKALRETVQEKSEAYLNNKLAANFNSWNYRETVRGDMFTFLYKLRNTVLRIDPQTKRKVIPTLKEKNLNALKALCKKAASKNIQVYVYIPPVRYDVSPPYFENEYNAAISEIQDLLKQYPNSHFKVMDRIIEGKYWGSKDPTAFFKKREYDFMHFQYPGHQILADSLTSFITL